MRDRDWQGRFWAGLHAAGEARMARQRVKLPQLVGLQRFAADHPFLGSVAQGALFGVGMGLFVLLLGLPLVLVGEADGWVATSARLAALSGVLFALGMGLFHRYQRGHPNRHW